MELPGYVSQQPGSAGHTELILHQLCHRLRVEGRGHGAAHEFPTSLCTLIPSLSPNALLSLPSSLPSVRKTKFHSFTQ